jgi:hypothetical protein
MGGWNGSGIFEKTYSWVQDQINGIKIRADRHDTNDTDFTNGINNCLTKDGQNAPTGNLPMATFKHTNVGKATALNQYTTAEQIIDSELTYYTATGTDTYVITPSPAITAYAEGQAFRVRFTNANTGAATININGLGAKTLVKNASTALSAGDLAATVIKDIYYDGTNFQVKDIAAASGGDVSSNTATSVNSEISLFSGTGGKTIKRATGTGFVKVSSGVYQTPAATITVAEGGTGLGTLTANNVILGNGTSTPSFVAPSTNGNVLTSDGTTWTSAALSVTGRILQTVSSMLSTYDSTGTAIPYDDTIPQNTEGKEYTTLAITPQSASSTLEIEVTMSINNTGALASACAALFVDSTANALAAYGNNQNSSLGTVITFTHRVASGSTSARTYKVRFGASSGSAYVNGDGTARRYGGVQFSGLVIREIL